VDLEGRTAVVTGASTGIGRAIAAKLAAAGCRLGLCARREEPLFETAEELRSPGTQLLAIPTDVSKEDDVRRFAAAIEEQLGPASILVNNAGIGSFGRFLELSTADFDDTFAVNVRGLFLCAQAFIPGMVKARDGVVVNIASLAGKNAFPTGAVYAASKHAVLGMSKSMMLDLREHNVRVLAICPGSVHTPFFDDQDHVTPDPARIMDPSDVADLVLTAIRLSDRATVSEVEIRPVNP
jgi:3-oxoacyl-[acyl-carrier protein] reductase